MGYSSRKYEKKRDERPWQVHPAWRGIGCVLAILVPLMAWAGAVVFLQNNSIIPLPADLTNPMRFQLTKYDLVNQVIVWVNANLGGRGLTLAQLLFWLAFILVGFGVLAILYGFMYRVVGPPKYGPLDSPPIKKGPRR